MVVRQLFERMWKRGLILVATSNTHPDDLYAGGLQRESFVPFIHELVKRCVVFDMHSTIDYREATSQARDSQSLIVSGPGSNDHIQSFFRQFCGDSAKPCSQSIDVMMGRSLHVPQAFDGCALFSFAELCGKALGAADYLALASHFHTVFVSDVYALRGQSEAEARRLITLVDCMYDQRVMLGMALEKPPRTMFAGIITREEAKQREREGISTSDVAVNDELASAKQRCISRLIDMGSLEYARAHAALHMPERLPKLRQEEADDGSASQTYVQS